MGNTNDYISSRTWEALRSEWRCIGYALVSSTSVIAIYIAKKNVNFSLSQSIVKTGLSTIVMAAVVLFA